MNSAGCSRGLPGRVSPFRDLRLKTPVCGSPKLIAACHVLHRLSLPRHPPCALSSLTIELTPRRQPNRFGPAQEITYFSASETGLVRSRAPSPVLLKTLILLEHLPESVT